jgi:hypothetical protein
VSVAASLRYLQERNRAYEQARDPGAIVLTATDFAHGGQPVSARLYDARGKALAAVDRLPDETLTDFKDRVLGLARGRPDVMGATLGGIPPVLGREPWLGALPLSAIKPPAPSLHASQLEALEIIRRHRRVVLRAGRRWGKSVLLAAVAIDALIIGQKVAIYAPTYAHLEKIFDPIAYAVETIKGARVNRGRWRARLANSGELDAWSLEHSDRAGRGGGYHLNVLDEVAFASDDLVRDFAIAILPTTIDFNGRIVEASTPNGIAATNHFWQACHETKLGFAEFHASSRANPFLSEEAIAYAVEGMSALEAQQEIDAEFVDLSGEALFAREHLLEDGKPIEIDEGLGRTFHAIGAAIDSGAGDPDGKSLGDATAAMIYGLAGPPQHILPFLLASGEAPFKLIILDWTLSSLAITEADGWMRQVGAMTRAWRSRFGPQCAYAGVAIEKSAMGLRLIEIAGMLGLGPQGIRDDWFAAGKSLRGKMVAPHVRRGRVKFGREAWEKTEPYKGVRQNHAVSQIVNFRAFDKQAGRRADDLYDAFCYACLLGLGDAEAGMFSRLDARRTA